MTEPREPIQITRQGNNMKKPWHNPKPTTNVASVERKDTKRVKAAIRADNAKIVRGIDNPEGTTKKGDGN